jgi:Xaa-Pro aminopeptidase
MRKAAPGVHEYELEALIDYTFRARGGVGPGYNTIVGAGENGTILHYTENECALRDGDLVLIDAGCEFDYYTADVTRTFPASGAFTDAQRRCYEIVLEAQLAGIAASRPGATIDEIHERCVEILVAGMVDLGLVQGPASDRIEDLSYKRYYMHRTSHWLGMDVHDVGAYNRDGAPRCLAPGMVITIEPGLYIGADDTDAPEALRGIGIRIEDDVLITEAGCENLTEACPKQVADIETTCRAVGT